MKDLITCFGGLIGFMAEKAWRTLKSPSVCVIGLTLFYNYLILFYDPVEKIDFSFILLELFLIIMVLVSLGIDLDNRYSEGRLDERRDQLNEEFMRRHQETLRNIVESLEISHPVVQRELKKIQEQNRSEEEARRENIKIDF